MKNIALSAIVHKFKELAFLKLKTIAGLVILAFLAGASLPLILSDFCNTQIIIPQQASGEKVSEENMQLFLCPQDSCAQKLIGFYETASKSIHVMIYSLTKQEIADALIAAKNRGIEVKVLIDNSQAGLKDAKDELLESNGIELKRVNLEGYHIMHDKVSIIDYKAFSTGSFNYTENANSGNAENLLIVKDSKMAERLEQEFQNYWNDS